MVHTPVFDCFKAARKSGGKAIQLMRYLSHRCCGKSNIARLALGFRCETISSTNPTAAKPKRAAQSGKSCLRHAETDLAKKIPVHTANPAENDLIDNPERRSSATSELALPTVAGKAALVESAGMAENRCSEPQIEQNR